MKITPAVCALAVLAANAFAQSGNIVPQSGTPIGVSLTDAVSTGNFQNPSGVCMSYNAIRYNPLTGDLYACKTTTFALMGSWTKLNPTATAGTGTVTNSVGSLDAGHLLVGNTGADLTASSLTVSVLRTVNGVPSGASATDVANLFSGTGPCLYSDGTKGACGGTGGGGAGTWGSITGTITSQTDLASALAGKQATGSYLTALSGDASASGPGSATSTVTRVNGTTVPANAAADQVVVTTASATGAWASVPNCTDTGGNHLNYATGSHAFSCGTSGGAGGGGTATAIQAGTLASASATPAVGYLYQASDVTTGPQIYYATATNTLVQLLTLGASNGLTWGATNNTLDINTAIVPRLAAANSFTGSNTFGGTTALTNATCSGTCTGFGGASFYQTVKASGTGATQRAAINFTGSGVSVSDDSGNNQTTVTITGGSGFTGTTGSVPFVGGGGTLTQNNAKLFWDNTNFYLGVGTASPRVALDITLAAGASAVLTSTNTATADAVAYYQETNSGHWGMQVWNSANGGNLPGTWALMMNSPSPGTGGSSIRQYARTNGEIGLGGAIDNVTLAGALLKLSADGTTATLGGSSLANNVLMEYVNTSTGGDYAGALVHHFLTPTREYYYGLQGRGAGAPDTFYMFDATNSQYILQLKDDQWKLQANLQLQPNHARPTCASGIRGTMFFTNSAGGTIDHLDVCRKDAADAYGWQSIF
jgi:hypothetical protein